MFKQIILILTAILLPLSVMASHRYERYEVFISPVNGTWIIKPGEIACFEVSVLHDNIPLKDGIVFYEISEDMMSSRMEGELKIRNGKGVIDGGSLQSPGFLRCKATFKSEEYEYSSLGTYAYSPDEIRPTVKYPKDFETFWDNNIEEARGCKLAPRILEIPEQSNDRVTVYKISYSVGHEKRRFYGMLAIPKGDRKFPAVVIYPGAGVYPIQSAMDFAENGIISLSIGIHGIPGDLDSRVYKNLDWGALQNYQTHNMNVRDRYYYRRVVMGAVRAIDFLLDLKECNGCIGVYGGSQGGFLSIAAAALCPEVKCLVAHFPAMSDLTGYLYGRAGGWPHMLRDDWNRTSDIINTLSYYDTVNFARSVKAPGFYTYGYNDITCPPTSVAAVLNSIDGEKEIMIAPTTEHYTFTEQYRASVNWIVDKLKSCSDD